MVHRVMTDKQIGRRLWLMALVLLLAFGAVGFRLVELQVLRHEELRGTQQRFTQRTFLREPRRGEIRDIRGNILATSRFVKTVFADLEMVGAHQALLARTVASLLEVNEGELLRRLAPRYHTNALGAVKLDRHVVLKRNVEETRWREIRAALGAMQFGVDERKLSKTERRAFQQIRDYAISADPWEDQLRVFPHGAFASHVLGFVGIRERRTPQGVVTETMGRDGVERTLESFLSGVVGWRETETDIGKREMVTFRTQDILPRSGLNAILTLDAGVQDIVEGELAAAVQQHRPVAGIAIAVRPRTGDILAMANWPTFDPNRPGASPMDALRNRAIADMVEPGSTFKIVVISGALNDGAVSLTDAFDCERGHFVYAGKVLHDHHPYGVLSVENILAKSSNIGAAKVGMRMGAPRLWHYMREYGFGEPTGIALPGEARGLVHPLSRWTKLSISRIPMGHEVMVTPLQMVMAISAIANQGRLMQPRLVDHLEDEHGNVVTRYGPRQVRQVVGEATVQKMLVALKQVVSTNGTADRARLAHYTVAGKTGTAEKYKPGNYYLASFVGFFPADQPEVCLGVFLDEPRGLHTGGAVAAPVFKAMAEKVARYLSLPVPVLPEVPETPGSYAAAEARERGDHPRPVPSTRTN